jgi:LuxR family maltose regulon positive regulatory protein
MEKAEKRGLPSRIADAYILQALAAKARGERGEAGEWIAKAVAVAEPRGLVRRFVRRGAGVADLLRERYAGARSRFVDRLLEAFDDDAARRADSGRARRADERLPPEARDGLSRDLPAEALTPREAEVIKLLGDGLTADEIARRTFVATSTVRSHIKSIYAKLGAHRRVEALRRAGELGFL